MGTSQSMIDSGLKLCDCLNHLHINCKSAICSFDVDTKEITLESLPPMSRIGSKLSNVRSGSSIASLNSDEENENDNMDSFRTIPPPVEFLT